MNCLVKSLSFGAIAALGIALPATAHALCASAIGSGWYMGCSLNGDGNAAVYTGYPAWNRFGAQFGKTIIVASASNYTTVFMVTEEQRIWSYSSGYGQTDLTRFDATPQWQSVAAGDESQAGDIWATTTEGTVWIDTNPYDEAPSWTQIAAPGSGVAVKVAMFDLRQSCSQAGNEFNLIHTPVIIDSNHHIFKFETIVGEPCSFGVWQQISGAAVDITDRYMLGTNNYIYEFQSGAFVEAYAPLSNGTKAIANGPNGLFAISNSGSINALDPI